MNSSISPSSTACTFPLSWRVRSSLTSWYGLQRVRADLAPERDVALLARERVEFQLALLALPFREPCREDLHRARLVLRLRALVLHRHHDTGGQVRDADRRVGDVDVLAARTRRPVRVDPQVAGIDLRLLRLVECGDDVEGRERGLAARVGVERRDADEPVHAALAAEQAVGVPALDRERRGADPGLRARLRLRGSPTRSRGAPPSAGTCAAACWSSPARRCRRRRSSPCRSRRGRRAHPRTTRAARDRRAAPRVPRRRRRAPPRPTRRPPRVRARASVSRSESCWSSAS